MITALIRPLDVVGVEAGEGAVGEAECGRCGVVAPGGEDNARENEDWELSEDGDLLCGLCVADGGPAGFYDPAYYG